ncbi:MAG: hypothetical protein PT939_05030 [Aerococcus suis]|nr:hypothetical protein [Aerococcus suis]
MNNRLDIESEIEVIFEELQGYYQNKNEKEDDSLYKALDKYGLAVGLGQIDEHNSHLERMFDCGVNDNCYLIEKELKQLIINSTILLAYFRDVNGL